MSYKKKKSQKKQKKIPPAVRELVIVLDNDCYPSELHPIVAAIRKIKGVKGINPILRSTRDLPGWQEEKEAGMSELSSASETSEDLYEGLTPEQRRECEATEWEVETLTLLGR